MGNNFYKVNPGDVPLTTDVNQYADAFQGNADVGALNFADYLSSPSSAPTATATAGSGLSVGQYQYVYTFVTGYRRANGSLIINGETLPSPAATVTTTSSNATVNLTNIATSSASYVIARRIYRTKVGGSTFYLLTTINDNTTTTLVDNTPDNSLSTQVAPTVNTTGTGFSKLNIVGSSYSSLTSIQQDNAGDLLISNNQKAIVNESATATYLTGNAYFDGTNWYRYSPVQGASALAIQNNQEPQFWSIGTGTGPITWNQYNIFHEGNFTKRTHVEAYLSTNQVFSSANSWYRVMFDTINIDYLAEFSTSNGYFTALNSGIYAISYTLRFENLAYPVTIITGTNQINRSGNYYNVTQTVASAGPVNIHGAQVLYMSAGTQLEIRAQVDNTNGGTARIGGYNYTTFVEIQRIA